MDLSALKEKLFFGVQDVARAGGLTLPSAHVLCSRCVKDGRFLRLKRDFYVIADNFRQYGTRRRLQLANWLQVPSYLSLTTALAYHEVTSQVPRDRFESVSLHRSKTIRAGNTTFVYHKLHQRLYFGFTRREDLFLAEPEKALLDAAYLSVLGHSAIDRDALDHDRIDAQRFGEYLTLFPQRFRRKMEALCRI